MTDSKRSSAMQKTSVMESRALSDTNISKLQKARNTITNMPQTTQLQIYELSICRTASPKIVNLNIYQLAEISIT